MGAVRALSATTVKLIDELHRLASQRSWFRAGHTKAIASLLQTIANTGEAFAIPRIISLAFDRRRQVAEAAGQAVKTLLRRVNVRDLGLFDRAFRMPPESAQWSEMKPDELRTVVGLRAGPTLLQLAMCHPSGYVRVEAIRRSATCADGSEIPFLLLRTNDWVAPVRDVALAALRARLTPTHVPDLVAALPMLDAMYRWGRLGPTRILDEIEQLLRGPDAVNALIAALTSPDRSTRRGAYRRLFEGARVGELVAAPHEPYRTPGTSPHALFAAAMRDADPAIRAWAGRWVVAADTDVFASFAEELLRSRMSAVRLAAAQRLLAAGMKLPWPDLLFDPSAAVRSLAQQAALDAGTDPDSEYRDRIAAVRGARLGVALVGLSETGGPPDAELVRTYLRSDQSVVRRSALHALASFKVDDFIDLALAALGDTSPSVTRAAGDILVARIASVRGDAVWSAFTTASSLAGQRAALDVLARLGSWESLPYLLRAFDACEALRPRALQYVVRWLDRHRRIFVSPAPALLDTTSRVLRDSKLPDDVRRRLADVLDARSR
jgi:HEAT repeat protein